MTIKKTWFSTEATFSMQELREMATDSKLAPIFYWLLRELKIN